MKVIYNTCFADPWVKVAQKLKKEHGFEPVYWIGYEHDDSKKLVPKAFPNMIYHPYYDAWKGIFPKEISGGFADSHIDIDFLKGIASYELQALKMMDRMDPDRYSFNFMERQRHFRNQIKYWTACINYLKPDLIVSMIVPHQLFDYIIYLLCKFYHIKFITFRYSSFLGWFIPITDISSIGDILDEEYAKILKSNSEIESLKQNLPAEIVKSYEKTKMDYALAEPDCMKQQLIEHKQSAGLLKLTKKFILDMHQFKEKYFCKDGFFKNGIPTYFKQKNKNIENSKSTVLSYSVLKFKANAYNNKLKKLYNSLVTEPDFSVPYVIVTLHYQPELSSSPSGDIFVDQRLCIEVLAKHIPADYLIYVKEHPSQFHAHLKGHTSRIPEFYNDLIAYPRVRFMPMHINPFSLFKNSRAVTTISGTSGWEAMVLGKPVIIFGSSWYEKYAGVLKIVDEKSASKITQFIENYKFDERNLLAYLNAFSKKSIKVYAQRGGNEKINEDKSEFVNTFAESILKMASK
ncbi:MAG: hypothetical protein MUD09_09195 [Desulfobacterales bacterium]|jgi:hypothetical protein|nr:hypothetical protein [Desulfobacterales bacterium]